MYPTSQIPYSYHPQRPQKPEPPKRGSHWRILLIGGIAVILIIIVGIIISSIIPVKSDTKTAATKTAKTAEVAKPTTNEKLKSAWQTALAGQKGDVDIAVYDKTQDLTTEYSTTESQFPTASIVKLSILEAVLVQDQAKGISMTASQLAQATPMIANSDNDAATALYTSVGGATGIGNLFSQLGMDKSASSKLGWGLTRTTAGDQLKILRAFAYPGGLLSSDSVQQVTNLLDQVEEDQLWGVSGGLPDDVTFELKNGWLPDNQTDDQYSTTDSWIVNSIGHVYGEGQDYVIAVLTNGNPSEDVGIESIEQLSTITWQTLTGK